MKAVPRVIIDTNVLVAGLRSRRGWSFYLVSRLGGGSFEHVVTVPLLMEYEDVLLRQDMVPLVPSEVQDILDYVCTSGVRQRIHFLWRPRLVDARDDMVLEAAVNGGCRWIVTHNVRHFEPAHSLGIRTASPRDFVEHLMKENRR